MTITGQFEIRLVFASQTPDAKIILVAQPHVGIVGEHYFHKLQFDYDPSGPRGSGVFSTVLAEGSSMPAGLTLSTNCIIEGDVTADLETSFKVEVSD